MKDKPKGGMTMKPKKKEMKGMKKSDAEGQRSLKKEMKKGMK
jgi:hypothetical protein